VQTYTSERVKEVPSGTARRELLNCFDSEQLLFHCAMLLQGSEELSYSVKNGKQLLLETTSL